VFNGFHYDIFISSLSLSLFESSLPPYPLLSPIQYLYFSPTDPHLHSSHNNNNNNNNITIIILVLDSTYEWKHVIFGFLSLSCLMKIDALHFYIFSSKWHNFILLCGWIILWGVYTSHILYLSIDCWAHRLIPQLCCGEQSCYKHGHTNISLVCWSAFLQIYSHD
jgi:hypothetical protein